MEPNDVQVHCVILLNHILHRMSNLIDSNVNSVYFFVFDPVF